MLLYNSKLIVPSNDVLKSWLILFCRIAPVDRSSVNFEFTVPSCDLRQLKVYSSVVNLLALPDSYTLREAGNEESLVLRQFISHN